MKSRKKKMRTTKKRREHQKFLALVLRLGFFGDIAVCRNEQTQKLIVNRERNGGEEEKKDKRRARRHTEALLLSGKGLVRTLAQNLPIQKAFVRFLSAWNIW